MDVKGIQTVGCWRELLNVNSQKASKKFRFPETANFPLFRNFAFQIFFKRWMSTEARL